MHFAQNFAQNSWVARPKKVEHLTVTRVKHASGTPSFKLEGYLPDGRRIRKRFKRKVDAIESKLQLEKEVEEGKVNYSLERTCLDSAQLRDAENAAAMLEERTLSEVVADYLNLEKQVAAKAKLSMGQAIGFFCSHYRPEIQELSIRAAVDLFNDSRVGIAKTTARSYKSGLKMLTKNPEKMVHEFTVHDIQKILSQYTSPGSQMVHRRTFNVFFNWAKRQHYAMENPCDRLDRPPPVETEVGILSREEAERLLKVAVMYHEGVMVPSVAIPLFAGLRPSEMEDLKPGDIREDYIRVTGGKMRRKLKRSVPIPPVLKSWLDLYPYTGRPKGWEFKMRRLKKLTKAKTWVDDVLRHTSISFQMERDKNEGVTAHNNGTSPQMINRHYREVIEDAKEVSKYWNLTPEEIKKVKADFDLNQREYFNWPTDAKLKQLVWKKPLSRLSKDLGVSDNAIRKRCFKRGIDLPQNGYWQKQKFIAG